MNPILTTCPVCGKELSATRLHCAGCDTVIEGQFRIEAAQSQGGFTAEQLRVLQPLARLSAEQLQFVLAFVRSDGRFNRMEEELKLSYPTLRNRMDDILRSMGAEPARDEGTSPAPVPLSAVERKRILDDLDAGRISLSEARRRLKGQGTEANTNPQEG